MERRRKNEFFCLFLIMAMVLIVLFCSFVSAAFGIASEYFKGNPLKMLAGESREVEFGRLQNVGEEDITLRVELIEGDEIANLEEEEYLVPAGTTDTVVNMEVSVPRDAREGDEFLIKVRFLDITPSKVEGTVAIAKSLTKSVGVLIVKELETKEKEEELAEKKPEAEEPRIWETSIVWLILVVVIVVALAVVIWFVIKSKRKFSDFVDI